MLMHGNVKEIQYCIEDECCSFDHCIAKSMESNNASNGKVVKVLAKCIAVEFHVSPNSSHVLTSHQHPYHSGGATLPSRLPHHP